MNKCPDTHDSNLPPGRIAAVLLITVLLALPLAGCAHIPDQWQEDGPSTVMDWDSATAADAFARFQPAQQLRRDWDRSEIGIENGAVSHWPLYFEDPFEDKGAGRDDHCIGWEDYVAMPYGYARFTLNWLMFPVSALVTPPCRLMESDGFLSAQALGYDHDATRASTGPELGASEPTTDDGPDEADPPADADPQAADNALAG